MGPSHKKFDVHDTSKLQQNFILMLKLFDLVIEKPLTRETLNFSTNADSITIALNRKKTKWEDLKKI